jgi:hypothetical protein
MRLAFVIRQPLSDPSPLISRHHALDHAGSLILIEAVAIERLPSRTSWRRVRYRGGSYLGHACLVSGSTSVREGRVRQALV